MYHNYLIGRNLEHGIAPIVEVENTVMTPTEELNSPMDMTAKLDQFDIDTNLNALSSPAPRSQLNSQHSQKERSVIEDK